MFSNEIQSLEVNVCIKRNNFMKIVKEGVTAVDVLRDEGIEVDEETLHIADIVCKKRVDEFVEKLKREEIEIDEDLAKY